MKYPLIACLFLLGFQAFADTLIPPPIKAPQILLPALGIDRAQITVSGISSGAFMAVQLGFAYSELFQGVGVIAGGLYGCAEGDINQASDLCMKTPENIDEKKFIAKVRESYLKREVDNPDNVSHQKVYILNGSKDPVVSPLAGHKLESFYKAFGAIVNAEYTLPIGHGFPSEKGGNSCEKTQLPWINRCAYDGAKKILETFYGNLTSPANNPVDPVIKFDQTEFGSQKSVMADQGHIFIPKDCRVANSGCRLHVALHGCMQSPNIVQNAFIENAGYNEWAAANKMVILYPAVSVGGINPSGCWDWFGYTGADYLIKSAPQMTTIRKMIERLAQPFTNN